MLKQMHDEQLTLLDIQEEVDTFMFEVERNSREGKKCEMIRCRDTIQLRQR